MVARVVPLVAAAFLSLLLALVAGSDLAVPLGSVSPVPLAWIAPLAAPLLLWCAWRRGDPARRAPSLGANGVSFGRSEVLGHRP